MKNKRAKKGNHFMSQSVGLEPTLPEGNWFLVSRLTHSATTAAMQIKNCT